MERRQLLKSIALGAAAVGAAALGGLYAYPLLFAKAHKSLMIAGSTAVSRFVVALFPPFLKQQPHADIALEGGDSLTGLVSLMSGGIDIAMMSRGLNIDEYSPDLRLNLIGFEGVAIIVNPSNSIKNLSSHQLNGIFTGRIKSWQEVGGAAEEVQLYGRDEQSNTRGLIQYFVMKGGAFSNKVVTLNSAKEVVDAVAADRNGIAYITVKHLQEGIRSLAINGVEVSNKTLLLDLYPLRREIFLVSKEPSSEITKQFIAFALDKSGQNILEDHGLTKVH